MERTPTISHVYEIIDALELIGRFRWKGAKKTWKDACDEHRPALDELVNVLKAGAKLSSLVTFDGFSIEGWRDGSCLASLCRAHWGLREFALGCVSPGTRGARLTGWFWGEAPDLRNVFSTDVTCATGWALFELIASERISHFYSKSANRLSHWLRQEMSLADFLGFSRTAPALSGDGASETAPRRLRSGDDAPAPSHYAQAELNFGDDAAPAADIETPRPPGRKGRKRGEAAAKVVGFLTANASSGRHFEDDEIAKATGVSVKTVKRVREKMRRLRPGPAVHASR